MQTDTVNGLLPPLPSVRGRAFSPSIFSGLATTFDIVIIMGTGLWC